MSDNRPGFFYRMLSFIGNTLLGLLKTLCRFAIRITVLFLLILVIVTISSQPDPIPERAALRIAPEGVIVEQYSFTPPLAQLMQDDPVHEVLLRDLIDGIEAAIHDERITSLVLELDKFSGAGLAKLEELSVTLQRFKESGKKIIAVGDNYNQSQYYLASFADQIYLNPFGAVEVTGFSSIQPYFKGALDKLKVNVHVFKVGSYKDFVEPFISDRMSDASREHKTEWLNTLWRTYTSRVESLRGLPTGAINNYINTIDTELEKRRGDTAQLALDNGLVDELRTRDQMRQALIQIAGKNRNGGYSRVDLDRYLVEVRAQQAVNNAFKQDKIAVIVAKGNILNGYQPSGSIGGDSLSALLMEVRKDPTVDALVLRVDSPGGSAFASELIRQEILQIKAKGIPVVVSMGSYAASGGYWIAANADQIWAAPTTLTGSIGIFGIFPTFEKSLAEIGVTTDGVRTTELAGFGSPLTTINEKNAKVLQSAIDGMYFKFLTLVAEGRHSSTDAVHQIAQGRVWTGEKALELGLVDQLGNLEEAIDAAAEIAEISDYQVNFLERKLSFREQFMRELSNGGAQIANWLNLSSLIPASIKQTWANTATPLVQELNNLDDPKGFYLRCFDCTVQ